MPKIYEREFQCMMTNVEKTACLIFTISGSVYERLVIRDRLWEGHVKTLEGLLRATH